MLLPTEAMRRIRAILATGIIRGFTTIVLILALGSETYADTWYLMAADLKVVSNPGVADRLSQGSRVGPLQFSSQGEFSSREECEPARQKIIEAWRKQAPLKRGAWGKYGITSVSEFIRCVPGSNPHLSESIESDKTKGPSMEIFLRNRFRH
jgi:DNA-binding Lrp family transcriptional regulator